MFAPILLTDRHARDSESDAMGPDVADPGKTGDRSGSLQRRIPARTDVQALAAQSMGKLWVVRRNDCEFARDRARVWRGVRAWRAPLRLRVTNDGITCRRIRTDSDGVYQVAAMDA